MAKQFCTYSASLVASKTPPALRMQGDPKDRDFVVVDISHLRGALKTIADVKSPDFDVSPTNLSAKTAACATDLVKPAGLNIKGFAFLGTRPVSNKWEPTTQIFVHPINTNDPKTGVICVAQDDGYWWQLSVQADPALSPNP